MNEAIVLRAYRVYAGGPGGTGANPGGTGANPGVSTHGVPVLLGLA